MSRQFTCRVFFRATPRGCLIKHGWFTKITFSPRVLRSQIKRRRWLETEVFHSHRPLNEPNNKPDFNPWAPRDPFQGPNPIALRRPMHKPHAHGSGCYTW